MQRVLHTITTDGITEDPRRLAHLHRHDPTPGCVAPCGYVWRNKPESNRAKQSPCPKCMNLDLNGLLTAAHACTKES